MEKLIKVLAIVVAIIIAIGIFSFVSKTSGLFKIGNSQPSTEADSTTEDTFG